MKAWQKNRSADRIDPAERLRDIAVFGDGRAYLVKSSTNFGSAKAAKWRLGV